MTRTTKYDYPAGCVTKSQRRSFRKKMRNAGKAPPTPKPSPTKLSSELGVPLTPQCDMYDASLLAGIRSTDLVAVKHSFLRDSGYVGIYRRDGSRPFCIFISLCNSFEYNPNGSLKERIDISRKTLEEILDLTFYAEPRAGNESPWFLFEPGKNVTDDMKEAFLDTRIKLLPEGKHRVLGYDDGRT